MEGGRSYQDITLLKKEEEIDARNRKDKEVKKKNISRLLVRCWMI